jgi:hypothetical protein
MNPAPTPVDMPAAAAMVRYMRTTGRPSPELADLARLVFAADRGANIPPGEPTDHEFAAVVGALGSTFDDLADRADEAPAVALPLIRPDFGGAFVASLRDSVLCVSYSGPAPFGDDVGRLFGHVADYLAFARRARFVVEGVRLEAVFSDLAEPSDDGDDEGADE